MALVPCTPLAETMTIEPGPSRTECALGIRKGAHSDGFLPGGGTGGQDQRQDPAGQIRIVQAGEDGSGKGGLLRPSARRRRSRRSRRPECPLGTGTFPFQHGPPCLRPYQAGRMHPIGIGGSVLVEHPPLPVHDTVFEGALGERIVQNLINHLSRTPRA